MITINNLELISKLLVFDTEDDFYHLQIIKRKKDNPEIGSNSYIVKTYYIRSLEHLQRVMPEIICICEFHNARAMINLNKRSFERLAYQMLKKVTDCILNKDFKSIRKSYESVCGAFSNEKDNKKWIIDVDTKIEEEVLEVEDYAKLREIPILAKVPTKNGYHLIVNSFNVRQALFTEDIHKNNPTMLYYKIKE